MEFNAWCYFPIIYYFPQKVCNFHCLYLGKNYCFKESLLLVFKCLNFNYFMLQSQKIKCLVLSRYLHSDPREGNWREAFPFPSSPLRVCLARSLTRNILARATILRDCKQSMLPITILIIILCLLHRRSTDLWLDFVKVRFGWFPLSGGKTDKCNLRERTQDTSGHYNS